MKDKKTRIGCYCLSGYILGAGLTGCATDPPKDTSDLCSIFAEKKAWYKNTQRAAQKWGAPIHLQMAFIHQESRFHHDARPPRDRLMGLIPWFRSSSAYGYAQAQDGTWEGYMVKTGSRGADRDDFADAVDFIGWYVHVSQRRLGLSKWDVYQQYLAYHEGHGGFKRKTYRNKPWLMGVARKVQHNAERYRTQLARCQDHLDKGWSIWPF